MEDMRAMKEKVRELFETQKLAVLSTQREGQPYTTLVAFAASSDLENLYFATTRATRKYANLSADSRVAMTNTSSRLGRTWRSSACSPA